jgi:hypothetical protein
MTVQEMHYQFKIGLDKVDSLSVPNFIAEEIDILLNNAQEQFISQRAFSNNPRREGLEETQKRLDDLKNIISNYNTTTFTTTADSKPNGVFVDLPANYRHAIQEEATVSYTDCNSTIQTLQAEIVPISHDRYNRIIRDPFNKPDKELIYRLGFEANTSERFEIILGPSTTLTNYIVRYIRKPQQIRYGTQYQTPTTDLDCELSLHTHREIVALAVKNALEDIESPRWQSSKIELNEIE